MGSIQAILIGWGKAIGVLPTTEAEGKLSELRLTFCKKCPFSKTSEILEFLDGHAKYENVIACKKCGCPCKQKTLVASERCPEKHW